MKTRAQKATKSGRRGSLSGSSRRAASSRGGNQTRVSQPRSRSSNKRGVATKRGKTTSQARRTKDHGEIQEWVEARGGHPSIVKRTAKGKGSQGGVLRIDFPGFSGEGSLEAVPWEEWFEVFDDRNLEFLYQEKTANGKPSRFNKLVCPE
jgi:hypothetical protein